MSNQWKDRDGRAATMVVAAIVVAVAGCASVPPPALTDDNLPMASDHIRDIVGHSLPEAGDTVDGIAERGWWFVPVYEFLQGEHRYGFGKAIGSHTSYEVVFIDSTLACTAQQGLDGDLLLWEWAGEPDGLAYLASRLRQACGFEPRSLPRPLNLSTAVSLEAGRSSSEAAESEDTGVGSSDGPPPRRQWSADPDDPVAMLGRILVGVPLGLVAAPFVIAGGAAALVVGAPWVIADESAKRRQLEQRKQMRLGLTRDEVVTLLGTPEIEFPLAAVDTTVLMYQAGRGTEYYVGLESDRVIWTHDRYPWLNDLAKQAKEAEKQKR